MLRKTGDRWDNTEHQSRRSIEQGGLEENLKKTCKELGKTRKKRWLNIKETSLKAMGAGSGMIWFLI